MRLNTSAVSAAFLALALSAEAATKKFDFAPTEDQRREAAGRPAAKTQTEKTSDAVTSAGAPVKVENPVGNILGGWRKAADAGKKLKAIAILAPGTRLLLDEEIAKHSKTGPVAVIFGAPKDTGPAEAALTSADFAFNGILAYAVINDVEGPYKDDWSALHESNATKNAKGKVTGEKKVVFYVGNTVAFAVDYAALATPEGAKAAAEKLQAAVAAYKPIEPAAGVSGTITNATGKLNDATGTATKTQDAVKGVTTPPAVPAAPAILNPLTPK